MGPGLGDKL